ncbi:MAG: 7-cyano-7-deazaguanine synthase, partial [Candidatus Binatia bacterium]
LDSCVMLAELGRAFDVCPVYVRSRLRWEEAEMHWLRRILATESFRGCEPLVVLDLPCDDLYGRHWSVCGEDVPGYDAETASNYLPGRNLLLLSKVAVLCALRAIDGVAMAPLAENPFADGSPEFFRLFETAASTALGRAVRIELPFRHLEKADVIRRAAGIPLELTFSCLQPVGVEHCGHCTKCAERRRGFLAAGVPDPTRYRRHVGDGAASKSR